MDVSEIISDIRNHGFSDTTEFSSTLITGHINDAYWDICSREDWPFLETSASVTLSTASVTKPTRFNRMLALIIPSNGQVVEPKPYSYILKNYSLSTTATGCPRFYYFIGENLYVYPTPDTSYTATALYIQYPAELAAADVEASILIPARHHRILTLGALVQLYTLDDQLDIAAAMKQQYEDRIRMMRHDLWNKQIDRPDMIYPIYEENSLYPYWEG